MPQLRGNDPLLGLNSRLFHLMISQVTPERNILHSWIILRGLDGTCYRWGDRFSLLIFIIEYGDGFAELGSTCIPLQVRLLDSRPNPYRYFSMRIQEWGIQYVYDGKIVMIRVVQRQHDGPFQRLAWDPEITGLVISLIDRGEWILAGGNHSDFPLSFNFEESISLFSDSLRSCSSSLWWQYVQSEEAMSGLEWSWRSGSFCMEVEC